jgi:chemotaxis regulatin CheY-phosphate phosphatase CheZ
MKNQSHFAQLTQTLLQFLKTYPKHYEECADALKALITTDFQGLTLE